MNLKLCNYTKVVIRPWDLEDIIFSLQVRNNPQLTKYFRQDEPLSFEKQKEFIKRDIAAYGHYNGMIIEVDGEKAGLCGVKSTGEFTLAVLPEYQHKGIATLAMNYLIKSNRGIWSEVFVGNPALEWFISVLGFKITGIEERAYYKRDRGMVDVVKIQHE